MTYSIINGIILYNNIIIYVETSNRVTYHNIILIGKIYIIILYVWKHDYKYCSV